MKMCAGSILAIISEFPEHHLWQQKKAPVVNPNRIDIRAKKRVNWGMTFVYRELSHGCFPLYGPGFGQADQMSIYRIRT
ncbi:hypothetical protein ROA7745_01740 [Roseovarius aestuarii]|uniref:Uncharacterized protein n=1 Tax=Roseovarius aestuarii TaxID=475083 RepID=A0A1X7BQQ4_9RHOB|nr:hypothetical protein ROA7745_01740 [Roseovarius aestuarii]